MFTFKCLIHASERQWGRRDCCACNWGEGSGVETVDGF